MVYDDGKKYVEEWKDGKSEGQGEMVSPNLSFYKKKKIKRE